MNKKIALKNLLDITKSCEYFGIKYFLVDGTLLGAYREKDFISFDQDIDIGVFGDQITLNDLSSLLREAIKMGFNIWHTFGKFGEFYEVALMRDGVKLDIFFYFRKGDKYIYHAFKNGGRNIPQDLITFEYPAEIFNKFTKIELSGYLFTALQNTLKMIILKYGDNWNIPDKRWNWATSPKNICQNTI